MNVFLVLWVLGIASATWGGVDKTKCEALAAKHNYELLERDFAGVFMTCEAKEPELGAEKDY